MPHGLRRAPRSSASVGAARTYILGGGRTQARLALALVLCCAGIVGLLLPPAVAAQTPPTATPGLRITELQAANTRTVADDRGRYADWIELHNPTTQPISLAGYTLTDDPDEPAKWRLPVTTLAPGAFLVVWASGEDRAGSAGWHTNFRLNSGGEYVGLFGPDGEVMDEVTFGHQLEDVSLGRPVRSDRWAAFPNPTPGTANTTQHRLRIPADAPLVEVTPGSGRFASPVTVQLHTPVPGSLLYYTLDGSDPTVDGQEYTAPLEVTETTVLRVVALDERVPVSAVTTATYLLGEPGTLPAVSLVTDPVHLWHERTGIYANAWGRGRSWERPVTVEWLPPAGELGFGVGAGLRIHGNVSRTIPKKSFRLYFRGEYGPRELAYPLFGAEPGQTYNRLVLRAVANDSLPCNEAPDWECHGGDAVYVRDQVVRDLHGVMGQVAARGRWVEVYLNGAYWGLYNLTERVGDDFLATHFDHEYWDVVRTTWEHVAWAAFMEWITGTDLSVAAQYEQALRQIDIGNFTSFVILWLWSGNAEIDWDAARMRRGPDTRWQLFVWDAEVTLGLKGIPSTEAVIGTGGQFSHILASLLANPQYQAYFTTQIERHLAGALNTAAVRQRLAALTEELRPVIAAEAARWLPDREPVAMVMQWEAAMQRVSDSLDISEQRLRQLSDPETLRPLLPQISVSDTPAPLPSGTRIALLVHHPAELAPSDVAVVTQLMTRGVTVNVIGTYDDSPYDPAQVAASHDLLLIGSSIRLLDTAARYAQSTMPIIFWEPQLLEVSRVPLSPWGGARSEQTYIRVVDADHPITAGLPIDQPLRVVHRPDTFSVAYPPRGPGVQVLALHEFGDDAAIMAAEAGAELANGRVVAARTVFLFWHDDTFHQSTGAAVQLFDRAVDWALGRSQ